MKDRFSLNDQTTELKHDDLTLLVDKSAPSSKADSPHDPIASLQRTIGNRALYGLLTSGTIQAKLKISQPNDIYEQEADRVADHITSMPDSAIQAKPT